MSDLTVIIDLLPELRIIIPEGEIEGIKVIGKFFPDTSLLSYPLAMSRAGNIIHQIKQASLGYFGACDLVIHAEACWQSFGIILAVVKYLHVDPRVLIMQDNGEIMNLKDFTEKEVMLEAEHNGPELNGTEPKLSKT